MARRWAAQPVKVPGVMWRQRTARYETYIWNTGSGERSGTQVSVGNYARYEDAAAAVLTARSALHTPEFMATVQKLREGASLAWTREPKDAQKDGMEGLFVT